MEDPAIQNFVRSDINGINYYLEKPFGKGRYATVWQASASGRMTSKSYAVKYYFDEDLMVDSFKREVKFMLRLAQADVNCQYSTMLVDSGITYKIANGLPIVRPWICMREEGCSVDDLLRFCISKYERAIPEQVVQNIIRQTILCLIFLRNVGIIHTDLKPANMLLSAKLHDIESTDDPLLVKLSDFGGSFFAGDIDETPTGTLKYASPEVLAGSKKIDYMADIWSLGMTAYKLLTDENLADPDDPVDHFELNTGANASDDASASDGTDDDDTDDDDASDDDAGDADAMDFTHITNPEENSAYSGDNEDDDNCVILRCLERILGVAPEEVRELFPNLYNGAQLKELEYPVERIRILDLLTRRFNFSTAPMIAEFVESCIRYRPRDRASHENLLQMSWLK